MDGPVTESRVELHRETLVGDVRDLLMNFVKNYREAMPYGSLSETKQAAIVDHIQASSEALIEEVVSIVASDGRESMRFSLKGIQQTTKGNIQVKLETPFTADAWAALGVASTVEIVVADSRAYQGERKSRFAHIVRDQRSMFGDDEGDEAPVMDQTDAGKKLGGTPSSKADDNKTKPNPAPTRDDVLREIAAKALRIHEHEEKPIDEAIRAAMKALKASCTPEELETVRKITGFDDGKMEPSQTPADPHTDANGFLTQDGRVEFIRLAVAAAKTKKLGAADAMRDVAKSFTSFEKVFDDPNFDGDGIEKEVAAAIAPKPGKKKKDSGSSLDDLPE